MLKFRASYTKLLEAVCPNQVKSAPKYPFIELDFGQSALAVLLYTSGAIFLPNLNKIYRFPVMLFPKQ